MDTVTLIACLIFTLNAVVSGRKTAPGCELPMDQLCKSAQLAMDCDVFMECYNNINSDFHYHRNHYHHWHGPHKRGCHCQSGKTTQKPHLQPTKPSPNMPSKECQMCPQFHTDFTTYLQRNTYKVEQILVGVCIYMMQIHHISNMADCEYVMKSFQPKVVIQLAEYLDKLICRKNLVCQRFANEAT